MILKASFWTIFILFYIGIQSQEDTSALNETLQRIEKLENLVNQQTYKAFQAIKNSGGSFYGDITFDALDVDAGLEGMDIHTGIFTAPLYGIYKFSYSGVVRCEESYIYVKKNGVDQFYIYDKNIGNDQFYLVNFTLSIWPS